MALTTKQRDNKIAACEKTIQAKTRVVAKHKANLAQAETALDIAKGEKQAWESFPVIDGPAPSTDGPAPSTKIAGQVSLTDDE